VELPMGTPIREIIEDHAGGMRDGYKLRGFLPGGASTDSCCLNIWMCSWISMPYPKPVAAWDRNPDCSR